MTMAQAQLDARMQSPFCINIDKDWSVNIQRYCNGAVVISVENEERQMNLSYSAFQQLFEMTLMETMEFIINTQSKSIVTFVDLDKELRVKLLKDENTGITITFIKRGTCQQLNIPLTIFTLLLEKEEIFMLAIEFLRGFIGFSAHFV